VTHVFVAPHPDDVALSCGGLITTLREIGESVAIVTVFSGIGAAAGLTTYQREALGFGSMEARPTPGSLARAGFAAGRPAGDEIPSPAPALTAERAGAEMARDLMAARRLEDERYASFAKALIVLLDLPDAVFRGYEGDAQLLAAPRADDRAPIDLLLAEIGRLEPEKVYLPLGVGDHVDHQLMREVGVALLEVSRGDVVPGRREEESHRREGRRGEVMSGLRWVTRGRDEVMPGRPEVMPGRDYAGAVTFYEDFPYAWWNDFHSLDDLPAGAFDRLPAGMGLAPEYADISGTVERKVAGVALYESQLERLFGGADQAGDAVRGFGAKVASLGGLPGFAERYWATSRL
jgi:LmbE family N-acetylglucosaminyl deacetylase